MQLKDLANLTETLQILSKSKNIADTFNTLSLSMQKAALASGKLSTEQLNLIATSNIFTPSVNGEMIAVSGLTLEEVKNAASTNMAAKEQLKATGTTSGLALSFKGLGIWIKDTTLALLKFLFLTPQGWAALTVSAIGIATMAVINYNKKIEENKKKIREAADEAKSAINTIKSDCDALAYDTNKVKKRYAELAQGVENLGKANQSRGTLSTEDYEEFLDLSNQLYKLFPQLAINFDNNGNAILSLSGNVDTIVGSLENLVSVQQELTNMQILEKMPKVWSGYMLDRKDYTYDLKDARYDLKETLRTVLDIEEDGRSITISSHDIDSNNFDDDYNSAIIKALEKCGYNFDQLEKLFKFAPIYTNYLGGLIKKVDGYTMDWDFSSLDESEFELFKKELHTQLGELSREYEKEIMLAKSKIDSLNSDLTSYINTWLSEEGIYKGLDKNMQAIVRSMFLSGDWISQIPRKIDKTNWDDVSDWLRESFLYEISKSQDNEEISKALSEVFSNAELTPTAKINYIKQIQDYLGKKSMVTILLQPQLEATTDTAKALRNSIRQLTDDHGMTDRKAYSYLMEEVDFDNFTLEQAELWLKVTRSAETAADAVERWKEALKDDTNGSKTSSVSETIDQLNTKIKPAFDSLKSAWQDIFRDDEFALNSIDILSTCDSIKSKLDNMAESGLKVDYTAYEHFIDVLNNSDSTADNVRESFNQLATSITQAGLSGAEDFETMKAALEDLGVVNNEIIAFDALINNTEALKEAGLDLANATEEEITIFAKKIVSDENAAQAVDMLTQAIQMYNFQKELSNLQKMNTAEEVANLRTLAENAGFTGEVIQYLTELEQIYQEVASGIYDTEGPILDEKLERAKQLEQLITDSSSKVSYAPEVVFDGIKNSAYSAGKNAAKSFTDALDKELNALDKKMEAGYIDFNDYIQARLKLIEAYYKQGKLSADEYYSYLEKHYDTQLSYMDKVVSAVTRRIDTEIDALKQQKEDVESLYKVQIESLEKQKTLLEEANQERQRQIDLQKSLYDLERARNQRTKLVYSEDKGMHYVADEQSIRDAQKSADDAKYNNQIAEIEKSISKLENARDQETSSIDAMISNLEEYKDAWSDVTSAYQEEQEDLLAAQFFGADWESKILSNRLDVLKDFKEQYIRIQQEIAAAAARESVNEQVGVTDKDNSGSKVDQKKQKKALDILKTPIQRLVSSLASSLTSSLSAQNQGILSHIQTYGSGTNNARKGLNLVGEDGAEAYFDNHGHVAIVTKPTLIPMEGGEVVKNERDTKGLLDPDNLAPADTIALADIDGKEARYTIKVDVEAETFTLSDGTVLTPLQPEGRMFELQQKFDAYMESIAHNVDMLSADIAREHSRQMQEITNPMTNSSTVNNRNVQPVMNQNITLNCPNVTNNSGIEYIRKELGHLSLRAMQESMK